MYVDTAILCGAKCETAKIITVLLGFKEQEDAEIGKGKVKQNDNRHLHYRNLLFMSMVNKRAKKDTLMKVQ